MAPALAIRALSKAFGGVQALKDVELTILPGEVHGLLGENGSGKSTLIKILAGYHAPDAGELEVNGVPVKLPLEPGQFRVLGLDFVHQDLGLVPSLSVVENLRLGHIASTRQWWHLSWRGQEREAKAVFARYGVDLPTGARVAELRPIERALLAILRASEGMRESLAGQHLGRGVLVLDEPTVFLPKQEIEKLFAFLRELVRTGASVLFVSHDLDEVRQITDRITVLRDGRAVGTVTTARVSKADLVELIIGHRLEAFVASRADLSRRPVAAAVSGLGGARLERVSFEIHEGEILGLTGLVGSGFEEIPYLLYGARNGEGRLRIGADELDLRHLTPSEALGHGLALIPSDRLRDGSVGSLTATDNVMLPVLERFFSRGALRRGAMAAASRDLMGRFDVRPADPTLRYAAFSGGNQQKLILAKWLQLAARVVLLHEPTQGVDVGARQQIYALLAEVARNGTAVLCASSNYEEQEAIADRVLIFDRGVLTQELAGVDVTKERIVEQSYGSGKGEPVPTSGEVIE